MSFAGVSGSIESFSKSLRSMALTYYANQIAHPRLVVRRTPPERYFDVRTHGHHPSHGKKITHDETFHTLDEEEEGGGGRDSGMLRLVTLIVR